MDGQIPVGDVHAMDELIAVSLAQQRFNMLLLGLFAALALILAAVGNLRRDGLCREPANA